MHSANHDQPNPYLKFGDDENYFLSSNHTVKEASGAVTWKFPSFQKKSMLHRLTHLLSKEEASEILKMVPHEFSKEADSVDLEPSYEYYLQHINGSSSASVPLVQFTQRIIEKRVLPYVHHRYGCKSCHVCTSLIRRYKDRERLRHPPHYDHQAFISVVVSLTSHSEDFSGGLYVRTFPGTEQFIIMKVGEALVHQHDLEHGVWVQHGERYSWILWLQDGVTCSPDSNPDWFINDAQSGDPIAKFHVGTLLQLLEGDEDAKLYNQRLALGLFKQAAEQGYPRAQFELGKAHYLGHGVDQNYTAAHHWYLKAAEQNYSTAAYNLGFMLANGRGVSQDVYASITWYQRCIADVFHPLKDAFNNLASMLYNHAGRDRNKDVVIALWKRAVDLGSTHAVKNLADIHTPQGDTAKILNISIECSLSSIQH